MHRHYKFNICVGALELTYGLKSFLLSLATKLAYASSIINKIRIMHLGQQLECNIFYRDNAMFLRKLLPIKKL